MFAGFQRAGEAVGGMLHAGKNQHHVELRIVQQMEEQVGFEVFRHFINDLGHGFGGIRPAADLHGFRRPAGIRG